jgi:glutathione synthase
MPRTKKPLKLLFISDPLSQFHPKRETTLYMMQEGFKRGHSIFATTAALLSSQNLEVYADCQQLQMIKPGKKQWCRVIRRKTIPLKTFDAIFLRKDPPFDEKYLHHLYLLDLLSSQIYMMNHPRGILVANEKLLPLNFPKLIPDTLVSTDPTELKGFISQHKKGTILKPLNSSGGRGIYLIPHEKTKNLQVILESITENFTRHIIAQAYIPAIKQGDKRIMVLGEKIMGSFVRLPAKGDHRANLHSGGSAYRYHYSKQDEKIVQQLIPTLQNLGLDFVGLDIIGDKLIEINITSPMGLAELNQWGYKNTEAQLIDFIEKKTISPA